MAPSIDVLPMKYKMSMGQTQKFLVGVIRSHGNILGIILEHIQNSWVYATARIQEKFVDILKPSETILIFDYHHKYSNLSNDREGKISAEALYERYEIGLTPHGDKPNFLMVDGHVEKRTPLSTLIKDDGSISTVGHISNTIWDSSPFRQ